MAAMLSTRSGGAWSIPQNAEINVTPFVDVMLVLLIIFMVALPVAQVSVKVDLPQAQAAAGPIQPPVVVSLTLSGQVFVGDRATTLAALPDVVTAALGPNPRDQRVYLRADEGVRYRELMGVMNRLRANGLEKVALIGEPIE
ncbi:biopolymer transporter ExbD [uncultured Phenylobacterium sp.]|uniref:ExbD/TolR family protein n=1 Tax=uncultured Phenylobacterium sp. TaxID=349273 RepID=UPI0025FC860F|nr:biopolymer transporter ExbD [uncultured Phenylobacterium sp.]